MQKLSQVKKGEYVQLKAGGPVWVRGDYYPAIKKYGVYKFDDVNHESFKKGETLVHVDFDF